MPNIEEYRQYDPYTETILEGKSGSLIVINRYGIDDYSAAWTDRDHLYDESFGYSVRGTLKDILDEMKDDI